MLLFINSVSLGFGVIYVSVWCIISVRVVVLCCLLLFNEWDQRWALLVFPNSDTRTLCISTVPNYTSYVLDFLLFCEACIDFRLVYSVRSNSKRSLIERSNSLFTCGSSKLLLPFVKWAITIIGFNYGPQACCCVELSHSMKICWNLEACHVINRLFVHRLLLLCLKRVQLLLP